MSNLVVRYRTKAEHADENQELVEAVFAELSERHPAGLRYMSLRLADGLSFIHVVDVDDSLTASPLSLLDAFNRFTAGIAGRCDEQPVARDATIVGSYRFDAD